MVKQKIEFITSNKKDLISLENLLARTLPQLGFERKGPYPVEIRVPRRDCSADFYIDSKGNELIYSYDLKKEGVYLACIDAPKIKADIYSSICELVNTSFPDLFKRRRVGA